MKWPLLEARAGVLLLGRHPKLELNCDNLKDHFSKEFILEVKRCYHDYITNNNPTNNKQYFIDSGCFADRHKSIEEISKYFENLLFAPNIAILDYVIENYDEVKNLDFVDFGAGLGLLSMFLKHIGIECYNFDNFSSTWWRTISKITTGVTIHEDVQQRLGLEICPITSQVDSSVYQAEVLVTSGIWITDVQFANMTWKKLLVDPRYFYKAGYGEKIAQKNNLILSGAYHSPTDPLDSMLVVYK